MVNNNLNKFKNLDKSNKIKFLSSYLIEFKNKSKYNIFESILYQINNKDVSEELLNDLYEIIIYKIEERKEENYKTLVLKKKLKLKQIRIIEEKDNWKVLESLMQEI